MSTPIALAFTPNYYVPVCTCLSSIFEHAEAKKELHIICLLTEVLPLEMMASLRELGEGLVKFSFVPIADQLPADIPIDERYTIAAFYRILLPNLLPELDKVLYVDCDMIFRNDLGHLFHSTQLGMNYVAGVFEATLDFQKSHMQSIGATPGSYVNSGFLLMNLKQLRSDQMVQKFINAARSSDLEFPDQDIINQLCKGRISGLPPFWNSIRTFLLPQYKSNFLQYYSLQDWVDVHQKGNIHYTGPKPWATFTVAFDIWWKQFDRLPLSLKQKIKFPRGLRLLGIVYSTVPGKASLDLVWNILRKLKH